uniref:B30.2/SPRY domain-containing protein n=1 Tax=Myripristis murdjan TaxID=586833 RepID=A0A667Y6G0_9TELE
TSLESPCPSWSSRLADTSSAFPAGGNPKIHSIYGGKVQVAQPGQNVTLTCEGPANATVRALWWRRADTDKTQTVLLNRDGHLESDEQHPSFVGRVELRDERLESGDLSVVLQNVSRDDQGKYQCRFLTDDAEDAGKSILDKQPSISVLRVEDPGELKQDTVAWCSSTGFYFILRRSVELQQAEFALYFRKLQHFNANRGRFIDLTCASQLSSVIQHLYNLSLSQERVPVLWKTSCLVPVPKKSTPSDLNDYRPVALTSHLMKVLERLVLAHLRPQVKERLDPLQFAYQPHLGVDDAVIYLLQRAHMHLDGGGSTVRITFFDFSSAFNTIQPLLLSEKLRVMGVLCVFSPSDACDLTLDPNTVSRKLRLSEDNRKATKVFEWQLYPDHPDRFNQQPQVLCREGLTGRCYWEVQWSGEVSIAVTYRGITRSGDDSLLGDNKQSWSLECSDNIYYVRHNRKSTNISVRPRGSNRVAVYLDCSAGTLSFYRVSSDGLRLLHTFSSTFTELLHPAFGMFNALYLMFYCQHICISCWTVHINKHMTGNVSEAFLTCSPWPGGT